MKLIVGIDIGNATTESTLAEVNGGDINVLSSGIVKTHWNKRYKGKCKRCICIFAESFPECWKRYV